jgi:hypothetical protein
VRAWDSATIQAVHCEGQGRLRGAWSASSRCAGTDQAPAPHKAEQGGGGVMQWCTQRSLTPCRRRRPCRRPWPPPCPCPSPHPLAGSWEPCRLQYSGAVHVRRSQWRYTCAVQVCRGVQHRRRLQAEQLSARGMPAGDSSSQPVPVPINQLHPALCSNTNHTRHASSTSRPTPWPSCQCWARV